MAIKFRAKAEDAIPAELQPLHVERDGAFVLVVAGAVDKARVDMCARVMSTAKSARRAEEAFEDEDTIARFIHNRLTAARTHDRNCYRTTRHSLLWTSEIGDDGEDNDRDDQANKEIRAPGGKMLHCNHKVVHIGPGLDSSLNHDWPETPRTWRASRIHRALLLGCEWNSSSLPGPSMPLKTLNKLKATSSIPFRLHSCILATLVRRFSLKIRDYKTAQGL